MLSGDGEDHNGGWFIFPRLVGLLIISKFVSGLIRQSSGAWHDDMRGSGGAASLIRKWRQVAYSLGLLRREKDPFVSIEKKPGCASKEGIHFFVHG